MLVLAVDTTSLHGGAGIYSDARPLAVVANQKPANLYSVTLFEMVERALADSALVLGDIDLFAVSKGPGSFTGIRVGLAAAQGWGKALNRPVCGVSVFEAMVEMANPQTEWALPIFDARRGEYYVGVVRRQRTGSVGSEGAVESPPHGFVLRPEVLPVFLKEHGLVDSQGLTWVARADDLSVRKLRDSLPGHWIEVPGTLLGAIAGIAFEAHRSGRLQPFVELQAQYVRRPDAELI